MVLNMKRNRKSFSKSAFFLTKIKRKKSCPKSETEFYLPDDCWEHVFKFLINNKRDFNSLSLVSKHFLSITNRLTLSIATRNPPPSLLSRFFHRFSNLHSLRLKFASRSLRPGTASALRHRTTLKSLSISKIDLYHTSDVTSHYIDSLASLKSLNSLEFSNSKISNNLLYSIAREGLPLKNFVLKNCSGFDYDGIYFLLSNCNAIQHLALRADFLTERQFAQLSLFLGGLVSIKLWDCFELTHSPLFTLIRNCRLLREITMGSILKESESVESFDSFRDLDVNPHLKFLSLRHNFFIEKESITLLASIFPNLEHLDLSFSKGLSEEGIRQVLSRCTKLRYFDFSFGNNVDGLRMNFLVPRLEVLNLSGTCVDDKTLYHISKSCSGLLVLSVSFCNYITEEGVMHAVEFCTKLKEIKMIFCEKVSVDVVLSIISSRPSLKKRELFINKF